jgi:hypothetical protein
MKLVSYFLVIDLRGIYRSAHLRQTIGAFFYVDGYREASASYVGAGLVSSVKRYCPLADLFNRMFYKELL